jgi:hypothetical protein
MVFKKGKRIKFQQFDVTFDHFVLSYGSKL